MNEQELQQEFARFEQQINSIQQQLQAVDQALSELKNLNLGLDDLKGKKDSEIFAPIGRGVFVKSKILSDELLVDIGEKNFVKKSISETKEIINEQIEKLDFAKNSLEKELEKINTEITEIMMNAQKSNSKENCNCGNNCECTEEDNCGCGHKH